LPTEVTVLDETVEDGLAHGRSDRREDGLDAPGLLTDVVPHRSEQFVLGRFAGRMDAGAAESGILDPGVPALREVRQGAGGEYVEERVLARDRARVGLEQHEEKILGDQRACAL